MYPLDVAMPDVILEANRLSSCTTVSMFHHVVQHHMLWYPHCLKMPLSKISGHRVQSFPRKEADIDSRVKAEKCFFVRQECDMCISRMCLFYSG